MTDPSAYKRRHCITCQELDVDGDGDDLSDDGECMSCEAAAREDDEPVEFDREMFDLRVRAEWEIG